MTSSIIILSAAFGIIFIGITLFINTQITNRKKQNLKNLIIDRGASHNQIYDTPPSDTPEKNKEKKPKNTGTISQKLKNAGGDMPVGGLPIKSIRYMLIQAGLKTPVYRFWIWSTVSAVICFLLAKTFGFSQITVILWTFIGLFGLPRFILKKKVANRQQKFLSEFADCLDGMMRLLKSGMPISEAIAMSAREYAGPIGEEMSKVYEDQRVGDTLPEAVQKMAFRMPLAEVKMFATAVTIQTQTGSSLSEVLQNLSNVIRQRFRLKRKVQALSAEAKISAGIIGCLPVIVVGSMYLTNYDYIALLWTTHMGKMLAYGALAWMGIGVFIMKQMINFKV